jgi:serine O-acetyltransferase
VGKTAVVSNDVSILQEVTLGGTGKQTGDRHPKVGSGVLIGAGAKILGNIPIGDCAKIGAGSVVLHSVPPHTTAAGVPARIVGPTREPIPALEMDQDFDHWQVCPLRRFQPAPRRSCSGLLRWGRRGC